MIIAKQDSIASFIFGVIIGTIMKEELLDLLREESFFKKKITLSSGKESNFYIDVRRASLSSKGSYLISNMIWELIKDDNIDAIGGPTLGADPIVGGVCVAAHEQNGSIGGFLIRKTPKKHGQQQLIEGKELIPGMRVVVIDDVATSGGSLIQAIDVLKEQKVEIVKALAVVDRQEGASEALAKLDCPLVSLFTKWDFISPDEEL